MQTHAVAGIGELTGFQGAIGLEEVGTDTLHGQPTLGVAHDPHEGRTDGDADGCEDAGDVARDVDALNPWCIGFVGNDTGIIGDRVAGILELQLHGEDVAGGRRIVDIPNDGDIG